MAVTSERCDGYAISVTRMTLEPGAGNTDQQPGVYECIGVWGGGLESHAEDEEDVPD